MSSSLCDAVTQGELKKISSVRLRLREDTMEALIRGEVDTVSIDPQRLSEIRGGARGVALGSYIDVDDDDWEDYCLSLPTVMAVDKEAGKRLIEAVQAALASGAAEEISDEASEAVSIVLASELPDQIAAADFLNNLYVQTAPRGANLASAS
jgi:hypothetical protein